MKMNPMLAKRAIKYSGMSPIDQRLGTYLGIDNVATGGNVTPDNATTISAVWCAVNLLSNSVMLLPWGVFERLKSGGNTSAESHPVYRLLRYRPNRNTSPSRFKKLMIVWRLLWGNARAEIERDQSGRPIALWPIHPSRVRTFTNDEGDIFHEVYGNSGPTVILADADVLHFMGLSLDGVTGLSIVGQARQSLGYTVSAEDYGYRFMANSARPSVVITVAKPMQLEQKNKFRESWQSGFGGANSGKTAILEVGQDIKTIGMPNKDAQFLETRTFQVLEIARWFNVPAHKLQELTRATFSNIEEQNIEYGVDSVMPLAKDLEDEADRKMVDPRAEGRFFTKFNFEALLRGNSEARSKYLTAMLANGTHTINDNRVISDLAPIGPEGDVHYVSTNLTTAERAMEGEKTGGNGQQPQEEPAPVRTLTGGTAGPILNGGSSQTVLFPRDFLPEVREVCAMFRPILADTMLRIGRIETGKINRSSKLPDFIEIMERFWKEHAGYADDAFAAILQSVGRLAAKTLNRKDFDESKLAVIRAGMVARHIENSRRTMHAGGGAVEHEKRAAEELEIAAAAFAAIKGDESGNGKAPAGA